MKAVNWIKENHWLVIILIVAAMLRFYRADFQSLWLDEILSMNDSNPDLTWTQFYETIMFWEFIPHLYFAILKIAFEIFGFTSMTGRIFSACIGVIGVYSIYLLGREIFSRKAGLVAAALLAVNIFHISFSQEIRPYGMLFLFTVLSFYRLLIFIRRANLRNAIYFGIFAGLIINSHFFGFITLFAQALILLCCIAKSDKADRNRFFWLSAASGVVIILVILPAYDAIVRVSEIQSFWLQKPGADAFTKMFSEFFGNSEMVLFVINIVVIYYFIRLFTHVPAKGNSFAEITTDKLLSGTLLLFGWIVPSLLIPLLRSYLDVPMILSRYFINILPVIIIVITLGIILINNKTVRTMVLATLLLFSVIDLFVVNKYYHTIRKSQFRELTQELIKRNPDKIKVVTYYSWLYPYFLTNAQIPIEGKSLEDHINSMKSGAAMQPFWYADANARPFAPSPQDQEFLNQHFFLEEKLEYVDAWAHLYVPKIQQKIDINAKLDLSLFKPGTLDANGHLMLFENTLLKSPAVPLEKGDYELIVRGRSSPAQPINGQNAHFKARLNGRDIGEFYLTENPNGGESKLSFMVAVPENGRLLLIYDNDVVVDGKDRNAVIESVQIKKK